MSSEKKTTKTVLESQWPSPRKVIRGHKKANDDVVEMKIVEKNVKGEAVTKDSGKATEENVVATKVTGEASGEKKKQKGKKTHRLKTKAL
ncbi:hypothetical protein L6452_42195 [Arctium lappa]|uniref:Uncharacterized protein n=1 Tax=Arctium lappa TaxID=4217 RepID=A0ACB8XI58_ARCLA|nr:hypothetical protein L6452_42195 [Arctium lappa]